MWFGISAMEYRQQETFCRQNRKMSPEHAREKWPYNLLGNPAN